MKKLLPIDWTYKTNWKATYKTFGFRGWLTLASPLANTILNWKYRNWELNIPDVDELPSNHIQK